MTTPAGLTYSQIETRVMNQIRIPTSNATEQTKVQAVINEVYRDIYVKEDWWWLVKRAVINTTAKITAGTINVVNGNTAMSFSSPPGTVAGFVLIVQGDTNDAGAVYRMVNATTFDSAFTGATNATAAYKLYQDSYAAPADMGKLLIAKRYGEFRPLNLVGADTLSQFKISDQTEGKPEVLTVYDFSTTGDPTTQRMIQVHPYPDKTYRIEIFYKQELNTELSGANQPFMPDEYRHILVYGALARCYPIFLNDLERGKFFQALFNDMLSLMMGTQREYAKDLPQWVPANNYRNSRRQSRTATTLGGWFDRLPSDLYR